MTTIVEEIARLVKEGYSEAYIEAHCYGKYFTSGEHEFH